MLGTEEHSRLLTDFLKDLLYTTNLDILFENKIIIDSHGDITLESGEDFSKRIFVNEGGILNFDRDPFIVSKENRFARELVLKELYKSQSQRGPSPRIM